MSDDIGASLDHCMLRVDALHTRIRELEAQIETLSIESATSRLAENRERERAEGAEAEHDILKALHDVSLASCRVWKECAEKAEAERDQFEGELRISQAAVGHNMGVAKRIEVATIERCLSACMCEDCDRSIRALKPSGDPCETQSEKPVNPYLLGGSSTQSEG